MQGFEKNLDIFILLSEAISEGIVVVNRAQEIVATNRRADILFRYEERELYGKPLDVLIPDSFRNIHRDHVQEYQKAEQQKRMADGRTLYGLRKTGEQFPLEVGLNPFELYGEHYVLALVYDMTELRAKDSEIRELNLQLEEKIIKRTRELEETVTELKRENRRRREAEARIKDALQKEKDLNELKTKFLSMVSHEFKTPLSGILTSATLIGKYTEASQQEKRDKHLKTIMGEVKRLNGILNDFLSMERLEQGKEVYRKTRFSLSKLINEVVYNANMTLKGGQKINYPRNVEGISLYQDEKIFFLTLTNLLYNAIKYSPEDSPIDLIVDLHDDKVTFHVTDRGIGIPERDQKHIFERYFRAENVLLTQGTGIGLNIVKGHVENLGGRIYFTSIFKKGSTFSVEFPLEESQEIA